MRSLCRVGTVSASFFFVLKTEPRVSSCLLRGLQLGKCETDVEHTRTEIAQPWRKLPKSPILKVAFDTVVQAVQRANRPYAALRWHETRPFCRKLTIQA